MVIRAVLLTAGMLYAAEIGPNDAALTVHEWGTFTSVADADGAPVRWLPLSGPRDLPCFVHRMNPQFLQKAGTSGTVRMETPVIYFYGQAPTTASVHVDFPKGILTEWYPRAKSEPSMQNANSIGWSAVALSRADAPVPRESAPSRYYAARNTDSMTVESAGEREKLLFYRGVGNFDVPVRATVSDAGITIASNGALAIPFAVVFENRDGRIAYASMRDVTGARLLEFSDLTGERVGIRNELENALITAGLYPLEASAMLETWRDSWFEEGLRVFYIVPRETVDAVLPLSISPAPAGLTRAFVGRAEVLAPWIRHELTSALASGDTGPLSKYGRFAGAFGGQLGVAGIDSRIQDWINGQERRALSQPCN